MVDGGLGDGLLELILGHGGNPAGKTKVRIIALCRRRVLSAADADAVVDCRWSPGACGG
jgi:hypothetical protein